MDKNRPGSNNLSVDSKKTVPPKNANLSAYSKHFEKKKEEKARPIPKSRRNNSRLQEDGGGVSFIVYEFLTLHILWH